RFWDATNNTYGKYVFGKDTGDTDGDGIIDYCVSSVTRNPPFYISVIDGLTGEEKTSAELKYSEVHDGSDQYSRDNKNSYMQNKGYYQMGGHFAICHDGKSLIFDISGDNSQPVALSSGITPSTLYLMNPKGHDYTFSGTGTLTGATVLRKGMQGKAVFNMNLNHTGKTVIHEGTLEVNGSIESPIYLMSRGTLAGNATVNGGIWFEGSHNYAGCRLMPGGDADKFGTITVNGNPQQFLLIYCNR
ncbi:MAG: hypothetical protein II575_10050, partial [Bacteroidales bacterium]|nr:hypothetical protein [Bacteroidales bacterium]